MWETIRLNKDLDLPTEKEMLAMFRCEEIMENAYKMYVLSPKSSHLIPPRCSYAGSIAEIRGEVEAKKYVSGFGTTVTAFVSQALCTCHASYLS